MTGNYKIYHGERTKKGCSVTVNAQALEPRLDLWNHSPDGFEWGYQGSGPAQLALAILVEEFQSVEFAIRMHQFFKQEYVAKISGNTWFLGSLRIREIVKSILTRQGERQGDKKANIN